jgi:hypothetical protein
MAPGPLISDEPSNDTVMTGTQVMKELAAKGSESIKRIHRTHGAGESCFGVKVSDLKLIHKKIKGEQALAMEL